MITELLAVAAKALLAAMFILASEIIIANYLTVRRFRKMTPRMPIAPGRNLLYGHLGDFSYKPGTYRIFERNHRELGKTFALILNEIAAISTVDLEFIKRSVLDEGNIDRFFTLTPIHEIEQDSVVKASGSQWKRLRRVYASALSEHKVKSRNVQDEINSVRERFLESLEWRLGENADIEINLDDLCSRWAFDQALTSFFKQPDIIDYKARQDYVVHIVERGFNSIVNPFLVFGIAFRVLHKVADWLAMNFHFTGKCREQLKNLVIKQALLNSKARTEAKADALKRGDQSFDFEKLDGYLMKDGVHFRRNIADFIIDKLEDGTLTRREYLHSTSFLFLAAGKTGADAIAGVIFHLAKHPRVQEQLRTSITIEGAKSEYLSWVVNESLRLIPPVEGPISRVLSGNLRTSDGLLVPEGTNVMVPVHIVHRLKECWGQDADEFKPERWAQAKSFHPCQFMPFGLGKRNCVGEKYALETIKTLLCALLQRYKFALSNETAELRVNRAILFTFLIMEQPTHVKISRLNSIGQNAL